MRSSDGALRGGVDSLLVDAQHRRLGIGRQLMEEAEAYYRTEGLDGMQLGVNAENAAARSLYDSVS
jgi:ribosomal protein S18 acetylase RimI-like enzyme